ncbi:MAG: hypothetical protein ABI877_04685 [Gemmatimonadaceae bacterium]
MRGLLIPESGHDRASHRIRAAGVDHLNREFATRRYVKTCESARHDTADSKKHISRVVPVHCDVERRGRLRFDRTRSEFSRRIRRRGLAARHGTGTQEDRGKVCAENPREANTKGTTASRSEWLVATEAKNRAQVTRDAQSHGACCTCCPFLSRLHSFYPYSSKYDAFLRGQAKLSVQETRGLLLFNDVRKGNCVRCHPSAMDHGAFPQFTDRGFVALGVPRNPRIPANADSMYFDLGLCGPLRTDLATRAEYCGLFKTPSLRNVALRPVFFHNGAFNTLEDVLRFYAQRDLSPTTFYQHDASGRLKEYDDLPPRYRSNVSHEVPFSASVAGKPSFSDSEAADIIAFLGALTDGYVPAASTDRR